MMSELQIRNMRECDIAEVVSIEKSIFSSAWSEKSFKDAMQSKDNIYLVALLNGKVIGYCGFWISYDVADLCNLAVDVSCRRQSVGEKLLMTGMDFVKKRQAERILLEVRAGNSQAQNLYKKTGFVCIGVRKGYYSNPPEDAVLMQKEF